MAVNKPKYIAGFGLIGLLMTMLLSGCGGDSAPAGSGTASLGGSSPSPLDPTIVMRSSEQGPAVSAPVSPLLADDDTEDPRIKANRRATLTTTPGAQQSQVRRARLDIGVP